MSSRLDLTRETYLLQYYSILSLTFLGFITNTLNIVISSRTEIQKTTMGYYNIVMSTFNILAILAKILQTFPSFGIQDLTLMSDAGCRLLPYLARVTIQMSTWINILISFDRLLFMSYTNIGAYNNRPLNQKDTKKLTKITFILIIIICIMNVPNLFFHLENETYLKNTTNQTTFIPACTASPLITSIRDIFSSAFRVVIPAGILVVISIILVYKLLRLKINVTTMSLKREYKFTFTIIVLNIVFILSDILILLGLVFINIYGYNQTYISTTSNASAVASFFYQCSVALNLFIIACLVFLVNLITNAKFRREAKKIFIENVCNIFK